MGRPATVDYDVADWFRYEFNRHETYTDDIVHLMDQVTADPTRAGGEYTPPTQPILGLFNLFKPTRRIIRHSNPDIAIVWRVYTNSFTFEYLLGPNTRLEP